MTGVSLPCDELESESGIGSDSFLSELSDKGIGSIELRTVHFDRNEDSVLHMAERIWRYGMQVSVHTVPRSPETALHDIFDPLKKLLSKNGLKSITLVLHPVNGSDLISCNKRMIDELTEYARSNRYPVKFALENNRKMPDHSDGDCTVFVRDVIAESDPEYVGLTFDFGHYAWYSRAWENRIPKLPAKDFLERVIHTHIHALKGAETENALHTTHFPLQIGKLPLREYIESLGTSYRGVFNLELDPPRFIQITDGREGILGSIEVLKKTIG